jgi:hypothetical protein
VSVSIWQLATLILVGIIVANLIVNPSFASSAIGFFTKVYKWAVNSMMGGNG